MLFRSLSVSELRFFDEQLENIVKAVLPATNTTAENERNNRLSAQKIYEHNNSKNNNKEDIEEQNEFGRELRRSIKTVEVMGRIIKNRAGSLDKARLKTIFKEAMNVHLRILTSFFDVIKEREGQEEIISLISNTIKKVLDKKAAERKKLGKYPRKPDKDELEKISKIIFWNINFFTIYCVIHKIINSIGSNKLTQIIEEICDEENTPASYLVKHGTLMWYNKNLQVDNISRKMEKKKFSNIAEEIMKLMIVNHCSMHNIGFKEKQRIEHKFNIPSKKLLKHSSENTA